MLSGHQTMKDARTFNVPLLERAMALALLILLSPLLISLCVALRIVSGAPVLVSARGPSSDRAIEVQMFRSSGVFGRFLESHAIDRMPSLWNVVRGELQLRELGLVTK